MCCLLMQHVASSNIACLGVLARVDPVHIYFSYFEYDRTSYIVTCTWNGSLHNAIVRYFQTKLCTHIITDLNLNI